MIALPITLEQAIRRNRIYHHLKRRLNRLRNPRTLFTVDNIPAKRKQLNRIRDRLAAKLAELSRDPRKQFSEAR